MNVFYCRGCGWRGPQWTWGWHYCDTAYTWWPAPLDEDAL